MPLAEYNRKRDFKKTPEPRGKAGPKKGRSFVVQKHAASHLHYDFRLELEGVLKSWAIPKGPSLDPKDKRLAMETEDHPVEYGSFEGIIPAGQYGGGTVLLWDRGTWTPVEDAHAGYRKGRLKFELHGEKLRGLFTLVKTKGDARGRSWLLFKDRDEFARPAARKAIVDARPESVQTGRSLEEIAAAPERVWRSNRDGDERRAVDASSVEGARKAALPAFVAPQLPTLVSEPVAGDGWVHEIKLDGYRILCRVDKGRATLASRNGKDWTAAFPSIAASATALPCERALLDGEVAALLPDGTTSFNALQNVASAKARLVYFVFDLLHLDGHDLTRSPLLARKAALKELLAGAPESLRYSDHVKGDGPGFFREACRMKLEGVVSKRADAPYESGRSRLWLKVKCLREQELVIGGFTDPEGMRAGIGALLLGVYDAKGRLEYAGKVGTGFTQTTAKELRRRLDALERKTCPFTERPKAVKSPHFVSPELVAEVAFSEWTPDGKLRHPSFRGLREDKPAKEVVREVPKRVEDVVRKR